MRKFGLVGVTVALVAAVSGCVASSEAGFSVISADGFPEMVGTVVDFEVEDQRGSGCFFLETDEGALYWVIWPEGAEQAFVRPPKDYDSGSVKLADGTVIDIGDRIELVGQAQTRNELPDGDNPDSMWGAFAGFCFNAPVADDEVFRAAEAQPVE
jgi:hypothetical protein